MFPIADPSMRTRVIEEILGTMRADNTKSWLLQPNCTYERRREPGGIRSQQRFIELARDRARENEAILGLTTKTVTPPTSRALDKLRRKVGKKRKRRRGED
jgi:hypothetical protein